MYQVVLFETVFDKSVAGNHKLSVQQQEIHYYADNLNARLCPLINHS